MNVLSVSRQFAAVIRQVGLGLVLAFVSLSALNVAMAVEPGVYSKFENRIETARKSGLNEVVVFDPRQEVCELDPEIIKSLKVIATEQAQIWGDTILEGDYEADGETTLDRVESVSDANGWLGYRITYSERAWFLGGAEVERLPGRISESSFVSGDQLVWLQDKLSYARFD